MCGLEGVRLGNGVGGVERSGGWGWRGVRMRGGRGRIWGRRKEEKGGSLFEETSRSLLGEMVQ
jgi:hypothetical protein